MSSYRCYGISLAVVGTLLFSLKSIFIKLLYIEGLDADSVLVIRMAIALPLYLGILGYCLWAKDSGEPAFTFRQFSLTVIAGVLGYYLASLLDLKGLELITAQLERLTLFSYPFFVALISVFVFGERFTKPLLFGLLISYSGLSLVILQEDMLLGSQVGLGVTLVMGSALAFAVYLVLSQSLIKQLGSLLFTSLAMTVSSIAVFLHGYAVVDVMALQVSLVAWVWLVLLAVMSTVLPSFLISAAIGRIGSSRASAIGMLGPVFTISFAVIWLGEPMTWLMMLGALLVISGVGLIQFKGR